MEHIIEIIHDLSCSSLLVGVIWYIWHDYMRMRAIIKKAKEDADNSQK